MADVVKIKVGYAYPSSPKADAHSGGKGRYYVDDNGSIFTYKDIVTATSMAMSLFRGYHKSGRMVQITNY